MRVVISSFCALLLIVMGFNAKPAQFPALIPFPQSIKWEEGNFNLKNCAYILVQNAALQKEAVSLKSYIFAQTGKEIPIVHHPRTGLGITLGLAKVLVKWNAKEAYQLQVHAGQILLRANTSNGIFNGLQTLYQLIKANEIRSCSITDFPAYQWRGYMVDVGRNFQSIASLKKQIDAMGRYKLNVFHFHLTEDIAWRLEIKKYPALTSPVNMQRNQGSYYTVEEMKDLISYCKSRYITLVPEIDMPGHSAAFTRAFGYNMQTTKGLAATKEILKEICETYNVPYIHIGADEVVIKNKEFLPAISQLIKSYHKQVMAWSPGGNYDDQTIRQLWKDEGEKELVKKTVKYVDSRSLYISDMDPLNTVTTIFNRQLGGKLHGDSTLLGAEFCLWNDRMVAQEDDLIKMNAVYPALLTFAERSWRGGGYELAFKIGSSDEEVIAFKEFEARLLIHKQNYFHSKPFTYVEQTKMKWQLIGPFPNEGNLMQSFPPEHNDFKTSNPIRAMGGTIWLWHTNSPAVKAWLPTFESNTTWYAQTYFFSKVDTVLGFWIDFKDQSRSGADATPNVGEWDYKRSKIWVNGTLIAPPTWKFAGRASGKLNEPLVDESFYYRDPIAIKVKKGWNKVLVKLPIDEFERKDWQVPPKWMFTFIPVKKVGLNYELEQVVFEPGM